MKPNIFEYFDYRQYILDVAAHLSRQEPSFSFSEFARSTGTRSPEFLREIRDRQLNIDPAGVDSLSEYLKLNGVEREYFQRIVAFDHAETRQEKEDTLHQVLQHREFPVIKELDQEQYDYFSLWYMPVVRELVVSAGYSDDPAWIADRIVPAVSVDQVVRAIEVLVSLSLICRDTENGRWMQTNAVVSTTSEVRSTAAVQYHKDILEMACESIGRYSSKERDVRSVTLSLTPEGFEEVKKRLEVMWKELLACSDKQKDPDRVYQVSMQLFPMSVAEGGSDDR